ncbi:MAG: nitrite/sulfite reductase [Burkholderiaceae bacterium]|nr:nitrite/sulfite reductase [Burkholderiaceae bacterium]
MYQYHQLDQRLVEERAAQFRDQTHRFLDGRLSAERFLPLRLQNGLYDERHAYMLRVAIPYGLLSSAQLRRLAAVAREFDRGYGHLTTRQNIQFNWIELDDVPTILERLAEVQMHAVQTSGSCVRGITTDHLAGVAPDEVVDPLVWAELLRQWSALNPEFAYLPRKFKIALSGAARDRAATAVHDIGIQASTDETGAIGLRVSVGGGLGRTPMIGQAIRDFLPWPHLLTYLEAILRVYNRYGRRDNKYKSRIKVLVRDRGIAGFRDEVEREWSRLADGRGTLTREQVARVESRFSRPAYRMLPDRTVDADRLLPGIKPFARWVSRNVHAHRVPGHVAVSLSLKRTGSAPGDIDADKMDAVATLAERYGYGELRVSHEQNLLLPDVEIDALPGLWRELRGIGLDTPNIGLLTDVICCPGGDYCSLANATSIPLAEEIQQRFDDLDYLFDIGEIDLNISGCINACGHHHIGHIGVLGVDKAGFEWYQITIGGRQSGPATLGRVVGPAVERERVPAVIERLIRTYLAIRAHDAERFIDTLTRVGHATFMESFDAQTDRPRR